MTERKEPFLCFLGTGAGDANWGVAGSDTLPAKDVRRYVSLFLAPDMLLDLNHQTAEALDTFGIQRDSVRHLLISHGHYDHFQPVATLSFAESLPHELTVYGNTMVGDALEFSREQRLDCASGRFVAEQRASNVSVSVLTPDTTVQVGEATVTAVLANHFMNKPYEIMEQQALNFVIEREGRTLFYGLDSSYVLPGTLEALSRFRFDVAVLDATFGPLEIDPMKSGHLNWKMLDETIVELREAGCVTDDTAIVADHLSTANVEPYDQVARCLSEKGITLAYDGMVLGL